MDNRLPIYELEPEILRLLAQDRRLIVSAPTGPANQPRFRKCFSTGVRWAAGR